MSMAFTPEQLERRRRFICATDVVAIAGVCKFKTPADIWQAKVYGGAPDRGNDATVVGNIIEPGLLAHTAQHLGLTEYTCGPFVVHANGYFAGTPDLIPGTDPSAATFTVEGKTSGILYDTDELDEWGDFGTGVVPPRVAAQCQWQMYVCGPRCVKSYVTTILRDRGWELFVVERDDVLIERLVEVADRFWWEHVIPQVPVAGWEADPKVMSRIQRLDAAVELDPNLVRVIRQGGDDGNKPEDVEKMVWAALGNATVGTFNGVEVVRAKPRMRKGHTVAPKHYHVLEYAGAN